MTDFETRARDAARAVRAVADTPADELAPRRNRGPARALLIAAAVIVVAAIVGTTLVTRDDSARPTAHVAAFCRELSRQLFGSGSVVNDLGFLHDAPKEIRAAASGVADAQASGSSDPLALTRLSDWHTMRCFPDVAQADAGPIDQRFAPRPLPGWFAVCRVSNVVLPRTADRAQLVILGDGRLRDPYDGPMVGLAWRRHGNFGDDRSGRPIAVAGHPAAVIRDDSVAFGGTPDTAQVIAWRESGVAVGVFGRGYGTARTAELAQIASAVRVDGSKPRVDPAAIAPGYRVVFNGPFGATTLLKGPSTYEVAADGGRARLVGSLSNVTTAAAVRFFATTLQPTTINGIRAWIGSLSGPAGPRNFIRWQASDRITLTLYGSGRSEKELREFVPKVRKLHRPEWERLVNSGKGCTATAFPAPTMTTVGR